MLKKIGAGRRRMLRGRSRKFAIGLGLALALGIVGTAYAEIYGDPFGAVAIGTTSSDNPSGWLVAIGNGGTATNERNCIEVCFGASVNTTGPAYSRNDVGAVTISGTGSANGGVAISGTGNNYPNCIWIGISGTGHACGLLAVSGTGYADGGLGISGLGESSGLISISGGDAQAGDNGFGRGVPGAAIGGNSATGPITIAALGGATGNLLGVSATGSSSANGYTVTSGEELPGVAISGTNNASGSDVSISGTGCANGGIEIDPACGL